MKCECGSSAPSIKTDKVLEYIKNKYRQYVVNKEKLLVAIIGGMRYDYKW